MLLDSNILIYGANGEHPALDVILDRTDLAAASVTRIETLGFHRLSEIERRWLETTFERMKILALDDAVAARAIALRQGPLGGFPCVELRVFTARDPELFRWQTRRRHARHKLQTRHDEHLAHDRRLGEAAVGTAVEN